MGLLKIYLAHVCDDSIVHVMPHYHPEDLLVVVKTEMSSHALWWCQL